MTSISPSTERRRYPAATLCRRSTAAVATAAFAFAGVAGAQQTYPQQTYPQTTYPQPTDPQTTYPQTTTPQTTYPQTTYPQTSYPQTTYPQTTYPQTTYPQTTYPQTTTPQTTYPQTTYPQTTYPQTTFPQQQQTYPGTATPVSPTYPPPSTYTPGAPAPASGPGPLRAVFANSVAAVLMATGTGLAVSLVSAIGGGIANWFSRKPDHAANASSAAPAAGAPAGTATYPSATYPGAMYPTTATGTTTPAAGAVPGSPTGMYAGLAYEVHAMTAGAPDSVVDPNTYVFRTGDRFQVQLRPSLPGRLDVYNVNANGRKSLIDSAPIAAGELTTLGPYQFAADVGDETLNIVLTACATPDLLTRTRDIVNVSPSAGGAPAVRLNACGTATRDLVQTRDIQKVAAEGTTSFALDPVAPAELSSGSLAPRQVTIVFHHR